jgi:hypothetical protein
MRETDPHRFKFMIIWEDFPFDSFEGYWYFYRYSWNLFTLGLTLIWLVTMIVTFENSEDRKSRDFKTIYNCKINGLIASCPTTHSKTYLSCDIHICILWHTYMRSKENKVQQSTWKRSLFRWKEKLQQSRPHALEKLVYERRHLIKFILCVKYLNSRWNFHLIIS